MCSVNEIPTFPNPDDTFVEEPPFQEEVIPLEPVDAVTITSICDNTVDILLMDQGPAHRLLGRTGEAPTLAAPTLEEGKVLDAPRAEHGFSAHVTVTKAERTHQILFDTGLSPNGCVENLARLDLSVSELEALVLSHGHFGHTTGSRGWCGFWGATVSRRYCIASSGAAVGSSSPGENHSSYPPPVLLSKGWNRPGSPVRCELYPCHPTMPQYSSTLVNFLPIMSRCYGSCGWLRLASPSNRLADRHERRGNPRLARSPGFSQRGSLCCPPRKQSVRRERLRHSEQPFGGTGAAEDAGGDAGALPQYPRRRK